MTAAPQSIKALFNAYAAEAQERFPHLKGAFLIMDIEQNAVYGSDSLTVMGQDAALRYIQHSPTTALLRRHEEETSRALYDPKRGINIIFVNDDIDLGGEKSLRRAFHLLDHELGHLGIEDGVCTKAGTPGALLGECIADAHAIIRHYQRFGAATDYADNYTSPFARAQSLIVGGNTSHFTALMLDEIVQRRNAIDFAALSPEETAALAREYALRYAPTEETLQKLDAAFTPVRETWKKDITAGIRQLAHLTATTEDEDIFRTGRLWLERFAAGSVSFNGADSRAPDISRPERLRLARQLEGRTYHFAHRSGPKERLAPKIWRALGLSPQV